MRLTSAHWLVFFGALGCASITTLAQQGTTLSGMAAQTSRDTSFVLGPPNDGKPIVVRARFELHDINEIDDESETFEFTGVMTLTWRDSRQAFDPAVAGVQEKVFQGDFQFNEISPGWYPQVVLINASGMFDEIGVVLRIQPDGTSTVIQAINAVAESELNMRRFPFDDHSLEAAFEVLGFGSDEVVLQCDSSVAQVQGRDVRIPQWRVLSASLEQRDRAASYAGSEGVASAVILSVLVQRRPFFVVRLVVIPLGVIVLLSFSVFWMDRSSLGDRLSVSFIGILTGVAYQLVVSESLPQISYFTLIHGFLNLSFLTMCATVVINLVVGAMDKRGKHQAGDRLDRRCRWIFPLIYFGLNLVMMGVALTWLDR